jgi:hypothetical protein
MIKIFGEILSILRPWETMALTPSNTYTCLTEKQQLLTNRTLEYHVNNTASLQITEYLMLKYLSKDLCNSWHFYFLPAY